MIRKEGNDEGGWREWRMMGEKSGGWKIMGIGYLHVAVMDSYSHSEMQLIGVED